VKADEAEALQGKSPLEVSPAFAGQDPGACLRRPVRSCISRPCGIDAPGVPRAPTPTSTKMILLTDIACGLGTGDDPARSRDTTSWHAAQALADMDGCEEQVSSFRWACTDGFARSHRPVVHSMQRHICDRYRTGGGPGGYPHHPGSDQQRGVATGALNLPVSSSLQRSLPGLFSRAAPLSIVLSHAAPCSSDRRIGLSWSLCAYETTAQ
jgi:hypothetical protein